jgi:hypothetical protein
MELKNNTKNNSLDKAKSQAGNMTSSVNSDSGYEMMSIPDGGTGNKKAIDDLKRANK